jgi:hypothetical protein
VSESVWDTAPERHLLGYAYKEFARIVGWGRAVDIGFRVWQEKRPPCKDGARAGQSRRGVLYVSRHISATNPSEIVRIAGEEDARKLSAEFGGEILFFGNLEPAFLSSRNRAIVAQVAEGRSVATVAFLFGLSERNVRRIRAAAAAATPMMEAP